MRQSNVRLASASTSEMTNGLSIRGSVTFITKNPAGASENAVSLLQGAKVIDAKVTQDGISA